MSDLETVGKILSESVVASTAKSAERSLRELENQDGFGLTLLHVVASTNLPISTRLAGALFFKNFIRRKWVDEDGNYLIPLNNVDLIKKEIVPLMITLPNNLQVQIGEAISIIADSDFPNNWPTLLNDLTSRLSADDMVTNKGVLTVAHSIFKRWRPLFRSDELFLEIKLVLDTFAIPFLNLLKTVDEKIKENRNNAAALSLLFDVLLVLTKLYYDLNCQDIPEFFEDNINVGMGILHGYLEYTNPLVDDPDETDEASILAKVKSSIQELVQLYATRYEDVFGPMLSEFIQSTWNLLTSISTQPKYDILVSKSLSFLTAVTRIPKYFEIFNNETAMNNITEQIILPNITLREADVELFEDDPIEYIRRDLEGADAETRRSGCNHFLQELKDKNEPLITNILLAHLKGFFEQYRMNPKENWKYKDLCIYLFTAIAAKGSVTSIGVSATNPLVDVIDFFNREITPDLTNDVPHPILRVDAVKYVYVFRNQLSKQQLIDIMPVLAKLLNSDEYIEYTYAAIVIERILSMRESINSTKLLFTKADLAGSSEILLSNLFALISKQGTTPEKLAENEFLMKAIYRVLQTSEETVQNMFPQLISQLITIVNIISKNPSNPRFTHYTFESIGSIIGNCPSTGVMQLIESMMPIYLSILSEDIQEFIPYIFQIIAFAIERSGTISDSIKQLAQPILSPTVWELKGNIPAVTRLLKAFIKTDPSIFPDLVPVLGVFQRLIASKIHDLQGFELLECIMLTIDVNILQPYIKQIAVLILQRLQNSRTDKFVKKLIVLFGLLAFKYESDFVVEFIDEVQVGLFSQIWGNFVVTTLPKIGNLFDRKIALLGATIIIKGNLFMNKYSNLVPQTLAAIVESTSSESIANMKSDFFDIDNIEEISTFGSSFSRLFSIPEKPYDPAPEVDPINGVRVYVSKSLLELIQSNNVFSSTIIPQLPNDIQLKLNQLISN
ncbi:hypothetical protein Kpol_460p18 [Vanderwaltozyma polyspora DSM 70294]|uniref:Importin N-terminal domain-containing protein n=1 Tax=Vanderwaltozyma polyspora (strain ATCC 22028 / DSM 70294 / BCRC 21397 / CBS 2163 / NBRC 10782 / NRRL Y-8283 / UCD 57-17) TaxID=436907 RepID=A7TQT4_VANPO|nr:uncharacterized protein Kpol_460p18 [Vanderwaltozyma polyspora DSM 70294]EDO15383.1 hypothetical protein Kpol_460p18 [Vanderwaltozyma polyspora DSM 70294]